MIGKVLVAALALSVLGVGAAAAEVACNATTHARYGETRAYFADTLGACRPDGYCSAVVALTDKDGAAYLHQLRIARPTAGAPHQVELVAVSPMPAAPADPMALAFGRDTVVLSGAIALTPQSANEFRVTDQVVADDIVTRLKRGREATWTYQSVAGRSQVVFPLSGLTAALAWVDCMALRQK